MIIKTYKLYTPSRRYTAGVSSEDTAARLSVRSFLIRLPAHAGRSNYDRITSRHEEVSTKELYRIIDFKRRKFGIEGKAETIEYDSYKNCHITLTSYKDGEKRYTSQPEGLKVGDVVIVTGSGLDIRPGNTMKLKNTPVGTTVHDVELKPGKGGQMIRSAGTYAQLMGKEEEYVILGLASGEMGQVLAEYMASISKVGNEGWANTTADKAGRNRHRGIRPRTRSSAVNPVDHPYGGGEDKGNSGRHPVMPWGKPTKGAETRRKEVSGKLIVLRGKRK